MVKNIMKFIKPSSSIVCQLRFVLLCAVLIVSLPMNHRSAAANTDDSLKEMHIQQDGEMTKPILVAFNIGKLNEKNSLDRLMVKAWAFQFVGRYEEALGVYEDVLSIEPDRLAAHYNKANCLIALKRTADSEVEIAEITKKWPKSLELLALKHKNRTKADKTGEKTEWEKEIERYKPVSSAETLFKANWYFVNGRSGEALRLYRDLQKERPGSIIPFLGEAEILIQRQRYQDAVSITDRVIAQNGSCGAAWRIKGDALAELNKLTEALANYNKSEELGVESAKLYGRRGDLFMKQRSYRDAVTDYTLALERAPTDYMILLGRANAYEKLQEKRKAYTDICNATDLAHDKFARLYYSRGKIASELGFRQDAIKSYEKFLHLTQDKDPYRAYAIAALASLSY